MRNLARNEERHARAALRDEIAANLSALAEFWQRHRPSEASEDEVHSMQKRRYALEFANARLPRFYRSEYERAMSAPAERLAAVDGLYADLDRILQIHRELNEALAQDRQSAASVEYPRFLHLAGRDWDELWRLAERLLERGNPI